MQLTVVHVRVYIMRAVYHDAASRETGTRSQMIFEKLQISDRCDTDNHRRPSRAGVLQYLLPVISGQQTVLEGVRNI